MMKKKEKSKTTRKNGNTEKTTKKRKRGTAGKQLDPSKVREDISKIVKNRARKITLAVAKKAGQGELAPAKFLFETAHIFPQPPEGTVPSTDEESLAKTLLDRLNVPDQPVVHDLYERGEEVMVIAPRAKEAEKPRVQESEQEEQKESVLAGVE